MKVHPSFMVWLSDVEERYLRWLWEDKGHKIGLCLYGVSFILYSIRFISPTFFPFGEKSIFWNAFLPTLGEVLEVGLSVAIINFIILCGMTFSFQLRVIVKGISCVLSDIPALGGAIIVLLIFPPHLAILIISSFSLSVRVLYAILSAEQYIPSEYIKTAQSLRLTLWQRFWRIHVPISFPVISRTVVRDMPEFWIRLLGTQAITLLMYPHTFIGCGGWALKAIEEKDITSFVIIFLISIIVIIMTHYAFITPLLHRSSRYDMAFSSSIFLNRSEEGHNIWWKNKRVISVFLFIFVSLIPLFLPFQPWHDIALISWKILLYTVPIIILCTLLWGGIGGIFIGLENADHYRHIGRLFSSICALSPLFMLFPFFSSKNIFIIFIIISIQGIFGWCVFSERKTNAHKRLYKTAKNLRVSRFSLWRYVYFPLVFPSLLHSIIFSLSLIWSQIYLAEIMIDFIDFSIHKGKNFLPISFYNEQIILIILMTFMIFALRHGIALPLQRHITRKYKVYL